MDLVNFYDKMPKKFRSGRLNNPNKHIHYLDLPFRMVIVGASGSGKTNTALNVINTVGCFDFIHVVTKDADEPLYKWLEDKYKKSKQLVITEGVDSLPDLASFDKDNNNLVVIDDMVLEKNQDAISEFYIRCRKKMVSIMYLSQSWYRIPIVIRQNLNYIIIKRFGSKKDISMMLRDYSLGVDRDELLQIYDFCISGNFNNFLLIDIFAPEESRFRRNWTVLDIEKDE